MPGFRATLLLLVLAGLASCGGGEGEEAPRARFVAQADAVCARLSKETVALADSTFGTAGAPVSDQDAEAYERKTEALQRGSLAELRALTPPPGDEARVTEILDALEQVGAELAALPAGDPGTPSAAAARFDRLARDYGLKECAQR